jgi:hypothetical protein
MSSFRLRNHAALGGALLTASACQIYPYAGQVTKSTTDKILFEGCSLGPNDTITLQAINFSRNPNSWESLGTIARSSSTVTNTDSTGRNWYCWSSPNVLPSQYWYADGTSPIAPAIIPGLFFARTMVLDNGSPVWTFQNPPGDCPQQGALAFTGSPPCAVSPGRTEFGDGSVQIWAQI